LKSVREKRARQRKGDSTNGAKPVNGFILVALGLPVAPLVVTLEALLKSLGLKKDCRRKRSAIPPSVRCEGRKTHLVSLKLAMLVVAARSSSSSRLSGNDVRLDKVSLPARVHTAKREVVAERVTLSLSRSLACKRERKRAKVSSTSMRRDSEGEKRRRTRELSTGSARGGRVAVELGVGGAVVAKSGVVDHVDFCETAR
jgi:hypothetical protein